MSIKFEENRTKGEHCHALCLSCKTETNHTVVVSIGMTKDDEDDYAYNWSHTNYEIIRCLGCDKISFRSIESHSEDIDFETGCANEVVNLYTRISNDILIGKYFPNIPDNIAHIYYETIKSFNYDNTILCAAGIRATIEGVCKDKEIEGKTLENKIDGLSESGILTKPNTEILHKLRFLGNEAVHELAKPSKKDLELAIEIVEIVFSTIYEISNKGQKLKNRNIPE